MRKQLLESRAITFFCTIFAVTTFTLGADDKDLQVNLENVHVSESPAGSAVAASLATGGVRITFKRPEKGFQGLGWNGFTSSHAYAAFFVNTEDVKDSVNKSNGVAIHVRGSGNEDYLALTITGESQDKNNNKIVSHYSAFVWLGDENWHWVHIPFSSFIQVDHAPDNNLQIVKIREIAFGSPYYWPDSWIEIDKFAFKTDLSVTTETLAKHISLDTAKASLKAKAPFVFVALGDSITNGAQLQRKLLETPYKRWSNQGTYTELLLNMLAMHYEYKDPEYLEAEILAKPQAKSQIIGANAGIPRDCAVHALSRIGSNVVAYKPNLVIVYVGVNDMLYHISTERYAAALREILYVVRSRLNASVILITPTPKANQLSLAEPYEKVCLKVAEEYSCDTVNFTDTLRGCADPTIYFAKDNIHLNEIGHKALADLLYKKLSE